MILLAFGPPLLLVVVVAIVTEVEAARAEAELDQEIRRAVDALIAIPGPERRIDRLLPSPFDDGADPALLLDTLELTQDMEVDNG